MKVIRVNDQVLLQIWSYYKIGPTISNLNRLLDHVISGGALQAKNKSFPTGDERERQWAGACNRSPHVGLKIGMDQANPRHS